MNLTEIGYARKYTIRTYEIDQNKRCSLPALIKLMHEAAMQNVIQIKLSVWDLEPHNISWVLMRMQLQIYRLPNFGETIEVRTTPSGFERFFTYRDYGVYTTDGEVLATSSSTWLLMDMTTRRMAKIPDFILDFSDKMPAPEDRLPRPKRSKLPSFEKAAFTNEYQVQYFDLDFNGHLNNVFYTKWMFETLPADHLKQFQLKSLRIEYRLEGRLHETIVSEIMPFGDNRFLHRLRRGDDELASAISEWA